MKKDKPSESASDKVARAKSDRRWTLLFIGDHGRVITLKRFKFMVIFTIFLFVAAASSIGALLVVAHRSRAMVDNLRSENKVAQKHIESLKHDNEILMARLYLAETRIRENVARADKPPADDKTVVKEKKSVAAPIEAEPLAKNAEPVVATVASDTKQTKPSPKRPLSVAVENFILSQKSDSGTLKVRFKLKNTSPGSQRVEGHTVVVLKGEKLKQRNWVTLPAVELSNGKPTGKKEGYKFSIRYYRTMRLTVQKPSFYNQFQTAEVYVFADDGNLLLVQQFPIDLEPDGVGTLSAPASDAVMRTLKGTAIQ